MNIDVQHVINEYKRQVAELQHEIILLRAQKAQEETEDNNE